MNLMRFARSIASVGQEVPARLQSDIATKIVTIVKSIAMMTTAYNATLRCAEHAWRTRTKFACISIATMIGPATINIHSAFGVVSCCSWSIGVTPAAV